MRLHLALIACILAAPALAGEKLLGTVAGTAGPTTKDNQNTAAPFIITPMALVTIQCDAPAYIATDVVNGATSTNGVKVGTDVLLPTSVGSAKTVVSSTSSAVISVIGVSGVVNCKVFERRGNE